MIQKSALVFREVDRVWRTSGRRDLDEKFHLRTLSSALRADAGLPRRLSPDLQKACRFAISRRYQDNHSWAENSSISSIYNRYAEHLVNTGYFEKSLPLWEEGLKLAKQILQTSLPFVKTAFEDAFIGKVTTLRKLDRLDDALACADDAVLTWKSRWGGLEVNPYKRACYVKMEILGQLGRGEDAKEVEREMNRTIFGAAVKLILQRRRET